jgi:Flp pilus assembly protein TadD
VILAPNSGLVRSTLSVASDRYSYASTLPLAALLAGAFCVLADWAARSGRAPGLAARAGLAASLLTALLGLCTLSWFQAATWRSSLALWTHAAAQLNGVVFAEINLGEALRDHGRFEEAEEHTRRGIALRPDEFIGHQNLGVELTMQGRYREAVPSFVESIRLNSDNAFARNMLGLAYIQLNDLPSAEEQFNEVLRLHPDHPEAHNNLGTILRWRGRRQEAAAHFAEAVRLRPGYAVARRNLEQMLAPEDSTPSARPAGSESSRRSDGHAVGRPS